MFEVCRDPNICIDSAIAQRSEVEALLKDGKIQKDGFDCEVS